MKILSPKILDFYENTERQSKFETNYITAPSENVVMQLCSSFQICFVALYSNSPLTPLKY